MNLKSIIQKPKEKKDLFWSLLIEEMWVASAIWTITDTLVEIVSTGLPTRWEKDEDLIAAVDASLSSCVQNLPEEYEEPSKVIFGVPSSWVGEGNIKSEHIYKIKKICQDLSLTPSGFVVLAEAIAHFIKASEGSPLSAILIGFSEKDLEMSVFRLGKLDGSTTVSRSVSPADDVMEGLTRLKTLETFPSRVCLFDGKEAELSEIKEKLSEASWEKAGQSQFLHTPKIEIIDPKDKILAVSLAGGAEIGGAQKLAEGIFGNEVAFNQENISVDDQNVSESKDLTPEELGFVVNDNIQNVVPDTVPLKNEPEAKIADVNTSLTTFKLKMGEVINNFKNRLKIKKGPIVNNDGKKPFSAVLIAATVVLVAIFIYWWFVPKADVTIYVSPKKLEENLTISIGDDITGKDVATTVTGEKTRQTTGTKTIGEKAKGTVKIQNGTAFPINIAVGVKVVSSSNLLFYTVEQASVSAAITPSSPGTSTVEVEAEAIGPDYNLAKDEIFTVGNYSKAEVDAASTDNFSGGSSRQIPAVSEDDLTALKESLLTELIDDAKDDWQTQISADEQLIEPSVKTDIDKEVFSNKKGDEATTLKLTMTLNASATAVSKEALSEKVKNAIGGKVPSGFVLRPDQIVYEFLKGDEDNVFDARITANLLPNINPQDVVSKIVGKYPKLALDYLSDVPGFVNAEFKIKPLLPGKLGTLPHVANRISVEISAAK